jgi:hypothetical protein
MQKKTPLHQAFREFRGIFADLSDLYQDFAYLSYAKDKDVNGSKEGIFDDLARIQQDVTNLCTIELISGVTLNSQGIDSAIRKIKDELGHVNTLADIDLWVKYTNNRLYENQLIDGLADSLHMEISQLYLRLCEMLANETLFPFWSKFPQTLTYQNVVENPQSVIQQAFTLFEEYLRRRIGVGADSYGEELINKAFGKNRLLSYSEIPAEQNGVRNLVSGAYATFRNPNMHRIIETDETSTLAIIALIYTLIDIVDKSELNAPL